MKRILFIAAAMLAAMGAGAQGGGLPQPQMPENVAYFEYNINKGEGIRMKTGCFYKGEIEAHLSRKIKS